MFLRADTLDDLMNQVYRLILERGEAVTSTRGKSSEIRGILIELLNPRARISRTESKGKLISSLGEFFWYLSGSDQLDFISHYLSEYQKESKDGILVRGAYGPRLCAQLPTVLNILRRKQSSRQAVIQLFESKDLLDESTSVPCTCTLQFLARSSKLEMITFMRSNDISCGFQHDIFCFTMLQEIVARSIGVEVGSYKHAVGSMHLYTDKLAEATSYLEEGLQPTSIHMPPMPLGDPWTQLKLSIKAESDIRHGTADYDINKSIDPYWRDLLLLLAYHASSKLTLKGPTTEEIRTQLSSEFYHSYIDMKNHRQEIINARKPQNKRAE